MSIVVVGLSHKTAPIEVREKLYFPEDTLPDALRKLMAYDGVRESLIVSTCNRVVIYASVADSAKGFDRIKQYISEYHGIPREALEGSLYVAAMSRASHLPPPAAPPKKDSRAVRQRKTRWTGVGEWAV